MSIQGLAPVMQLVRGSQTPRDKSRAYSSGAQTPNKCPPAKRERGKNLMSSPKRIQFNCAAWATKTPNTGCQTRRGSKKVQISKCEKREKDPIPPSRRKRAIATVVWRRGAPFSLCTCWKAWCITVARAAALDCCWWRNNERSLRCCAALSRAATDFPLGVQPEK